MLERLRSLTGTPSIIEKPRMSDLIAPPNTKPSEWQIAARPPMSERLSIRPAVSYSDEIVRVNKLPRRNPTPRRGVVVDALKRVRTTPCNCAALGAPRCITELNETQAWALTEIAETGGLVGFIGVGHGKTGLDILAAKVMPDCRTAVLLIPPTLRSQLRRDYLIWREHFHVPSFVFEDEGFIERGQPVVHVIPYSKFSRASATTLLESIRPDFLILDEAHKARYAQTATTGRILRYCAHRPEVRMVCWSGTLTGKSIKDYAHLSAISLKDGSPLPLDQNVLEDWSLAIDPSDWPAPMGALATFCKAGETAHQGFSRRLISTPGVITTTGSSVGASLYLLERKPPIPAALARQIEKLLDPERGWTRPDGEEFLDVLSVQRCAREMSSGFFYRWKYPRGEAEELIDRWFTLRKAWFKELRQKLKFRREHLDSPYLCEQAAQRYEEGYSGHLPTWHSANWPLWRDIRDQVKPETEPVWLDEFLVNDAVEWGGKHTGILWYDHAVVGRRIAEKGEFPYFGAGAEAEAALRELCTKKTRRTIVCSIKSRGTGFDGLQYLFDEQYIVNPLSSAAETEQLLGRLHREGQASDQVTTWVPRHTEIVSHAIDSAIMKARYIQGTTTNLQKLLVAATDFTPKVRTRYVDES